MGVAQKLQAELLKHPDITDVTLNGTKIYLEQNQLPDIFIQLETLKNDVKSSFNERSQVVEMSMIAGSNPYSSNSTLQDNWSPPLSYWSKSGDVTVDSHFEGVMVGNKQEAGIIESISEKMYAELETAFASAHEDSELVAKRNDIPGYFYPKYRPFELPIPLANYRPKRIANGNRPFLPNESYWTFTAPAGTQLPLKLLRDRMVKLDWDADDYEEGDPHAIPMLRLKKDTSLLEVWPLDRSLETTQAFSEPREYVIRLQDRMSRKEQQAMLDQAFAEDAPLEQIYLMKYWWRDQHREAFLKRIKQGENAGDPKFLVEAIEVLLDRDEKEEALRTIQIAYLISKASQENLRSELEQLGKAASGDNTWKLSLPTIDELPSLGYASIQPDEPIQFTLKPNVFYMVGASDGEEEQILFFGLKPASDGPILWRAHLGHLSDGSASWSNRGASLDELQSPTGAKFEANHNNIFGTFIVRQPDPTVEEFTVECHYTLRDEPEQS